MTEILNTEFSISIKDLPSNKIYISLNEDFNNSLINQLKQKNSLRQIYKTLKVNEGHFFKCKRTKQYPLTILLKLLKLTTFTIKDVENNLSSIKSGIIKGNKSGGISKPINPKFPIELSKEFTRIVAHIFGDGVLSISKKGYYNIAYYNQNRVLLNQFKQDILKIFGQNIYLKEGLNKTTNYIRLPSPVAIILFNKIKKFDSKNATIPSFIKKASKQIKKEFLKAFLDDEAHVRYNPPQRNIEITLCNLRLLKDIRNLLKEFNIKPTKICFKKIRGFDTYYFYIRNYHNLKIFFKQINFNHPYKKEKLYKIIKNPGRKSFARGESKQTILNLLKNKQYTIKELSKIINRKHCTVSYWLNTLKKQRKVKIVGFKKKTLRGKQLIWSLK